MQSVAKPDFPLVVSDFRRRRYNAQMRSDAATVDAYLAALPADRRDALRAEADDQRRHRQ
jgi:hypothetical protein